VFEDDFFQREDIYSISDTEEVTEEDHVADPDTLQNTSGRHAKEQDDK
jgi:hypothetical protein